MQHASAGAYGAFRSIFVGRQRDHGLCSLACGRYVGPAAAADREFESFDLLDLQTKQLLHRVRIGRLVASPATSNVYLPSSFPEYSSRSDGADG